MPPVSPFVMSAGQRGGVMVITLAGDLDITNRAVLAEQLSQALAQQPTRLVYDLTEVPYVDGGTLYLLMQAARRTGHEPVLMCPSPLVTRLLHVTGLETECAITPGQQPA